MIGDVGERDPALLAVQDVDAALLDRGRLNRPRIAAGAGFGQAVARDLLALRLRHEVLLLLRLGAPRQQRQAVEAGVHRHDHAQRRVDVLELLAGDAQADVIHARAAVLLRDGNTQKAERRHQRKDIRIEAVLPVEIVNAWGDFARGPFADRLLEQALLVGQVEVDHLLNSRSA